MGAYMKNIASYCFVAYFKKESAIPADYVRNIQIIAISGKRQTHATDIFQNMT